MRDPLDDLGEPTDEDLFVMDDWLAHGDGDDYLDDDGEELPKEVVVRVVDVVDGSTSLQEMAGRLYDYADELVDMYETGWDLVETISKGQGTAIILDEGDDHDG